MIKAREKLMLKRLTTEITDIMLMINYAWKLTFDQVSTNKVPLLNEDGSL